MSHRRLGALEIAPGRDRGRGEMDLVVGRHRQRLLGPPPKGQVKMFALDPDVADAADAAGDGHVVEIRADRHRRHELLGRDRFLLAGPVAAVAVEIDPAGAAGIVRRPGERELGRGCGVELRAVDEQMP